LNGAHVLLTGAGKVARGHGGVGELAPLVRRRPGATGERGEEPYESEASKK
jgi:hypothetical protein